MAALKTLGMANFYDKGRSEIAPYKAAAVLSDAEFGHAPKIGLLDNREASAYNSALHRGRFAHPENLNTRGRVVNRDHSQ